ncbi:leucine-rich PPR motif-containing protein, mitochondrial [Nilaparvata lugens]|uniref:leucine-rich PPR motif-containing protein, mitochondrial n=1 Tax=Nilaparvata lugens TaxID=108931 RepID=UPI00193DEE9B|nr:leucine-rich PPR motif-containing protein, mitochondrial [Nilaparvata lugens]
MSILRSARFIKYIGHARRLKTVQNISINVFSQPIKQADKSNLQSFRYFSPYAAEATRQQYDRSSLDRSIRRLDEDARRMGRISIKELKDVIQEIQSTKTATSTQSLMVIRCCGNLVPEETPEFRTKLVKEVWSTLEKLGIPMDVSHYNALLRVYLENEHPFSPVEFLSELEHKGIEPNRVTFQRLVAAYCQRADLDGATRILEYMREKQMPISEGVFNALIMGHAKAGDMESAKGIVGVMSQANLEPNNDTYTTLLCGYARVGDASAIESLLQECETKEICLGDRDYLEIIYTLAVNDQQQLIDFILTKIGRSTGYNQDAANVILRLTTRGKEDIAYKIYETMVPSTRAEGLPVASPGAFFVKQLVKANRPIESILKLCEAMKEKDQNSRGLLIATENALLSGNVELSIALIKALKDAYYPVRPHYFWPVLVKQNTRKDVVKVVRQMCDLKVTPTAETLREYVLPRALALGPVSAAVDLVAELKEAGVSIGASAAAIASYYLANNRMADAAAIASSYQAVYTVSISRIALVKSLLATKDVESFTRLMRAMIQTKSLPRSQAEDLVEEPVFDDREFIGRTLLEIVNKDRNFEVPYRELFQKCLEQGLGLSNSTAEQIQSQLSDANPTTDLSDLLTRLSGTDISPAPILRRLPVKFAPRNEESLLAIKKTLEAKGENTNGIKKQLLALYCSTDDVERAESYFKELKSEGYFLTAGMYAMMIEKYLDSKSHDKAFEMLNELREKEPDIKLDNIKSVKVATGLIESDRLQDALLFLQTQKREEGDLSKEAQKDKPFAYNVICWRLLNTIAEKGDADGTRQVFDALVDNGFIQVSNMFLGPLVKAHLVSNNLSGALNVFEWACHNFRATPLKKELSCKLIEKEDAASLQRLTDLSTIVHGEINSLHDLVLAFVECGRMRQARKILETPGLRVRTDRLISERYRGDADVKTLEGILQVTKDIAQVDRANIYSILLTNLIKLDNAEKALSLWTRMQEENVQPSDEFLHRLGTFLTEKGLSVPFVIPTVDVKAIKESDEDLTLPRRKLKMAFASKNWNAIMTAYKELKQQNVKLSPAEIAGLIQCALEEGRPIQTIAELAGEILATNVEFPRFKLAYLTKKLAQTGDVESLEHFGHFFTEDQKKNTKFENMRYLCYIEAGKVSDIMDKVEKIVRGANSEEDFKKAEKIPLGGMIHILKASPEVCERVEKLCAECSEKGNSVLANTLWAYYLFVGDVQSADRIFNKHLKSSNFLSYRLVSNSAIKNLDEELADTLGKYLEQYEHASSANHANIYSSKMNIMIRKNEMERALEFLHSISSKVPTSELSPVVMIQLKKYATARGKSFPYEIPQSKQGRKGDQEDISDSDSEEYNNSRQTNQRLSS